MTEQGDLLSWSSPDSDRHGRTFDRELDGKRLNGQALRVYEAMIDGVYRTLREIHDITGDPEASISSRLRDFDKPEMSQLNIYKDSRRRAGMEKRGVWEYALLSRRKP